jgi:hypothetical protein
MSSARSSGVNVALVDTKLARRGFLPIIVPALLKVLPFLKKGEVREIRIASWRPIPANEIGNG